MNNRNETDRTRESCKWKPMKSNLEDKNYNLSKTWETEGKAWENKGKKSGTIHYREKRIHIKKKQIPEKTQYHKTLLLHYSLSRHHIIQTINPL